MNDPIADALTFPPATGTPKAEAYEKFVESMVPHCRCDAEYRPCDGVLAGGLCDNFHPRDELCDDDRVSLAYEEDDLPAADRPEDF